MKKIAIIISMFPIYAIAAPPPLPPGVDSCGIPANSVVGEESNHEVTLRIVKPSEYVLAGQDNTLTVKTYGATQSVEWFNTADGSMGTSSHTRRPVGSTEKSKILNLPSGKHTVWATSVGEGLFNITELVNHYYCGRDGNGQLIEVDQNTYNNCHLSLRSTWLEIKVLGQETISWDLCAYDEIIAVDKPISVVSANYTDTGSRVEGSISVEAQIDPNSRAGSGEVEPKYDIQEFAISEWNGRRCEIVEESSSWVSRRQNSTNNSFSFNYFGCEYEFRSRVFDGEFYSNWDIVTVSGSASSNGSGGSGGSGNPGGPGGGSCSGPFCEEEN
ncbi:MAG: hypothetical protein ABJI60_01070 [Kangiellaceae bacterium]